MAQFRNRNRNRFGGGNGGALPLMIGALQGEMRINYVEVTVGTGGMFATMGEAADYCNTMLTLDFYNRCRVRLLAGTHTLTRYVVFNDFIDLVGEGEASTTIDFSHTAVADTFDLLTSNFRAAIVVGFNSRLEDFTYNCTFLNTFADYNAFVFLHGARDRDEIADEPDDSFARVNRVTMTVLGKRCFLSLSRADGGSGAFLYNTHHYIFNDTTITGSTHGFASFGGQVPQVFLMGSAWECGEYNQVNTILGVSEYWTVLLNPFLAFSKNKFGCAVINSTIRQWSYDAFFCQNVNVEYATFTGGWGHFINSTLESNNHDPVNNVAANCFMNAQDDVFLADYPDATWNLKLETTTLISNTTPGGTYPGHLRWGKPVIATGPFPTLDYDGIGTNPVILFWPP